jgi:hypothetical protein
MYREKKQFILRYKIVLIITDKSFDFKGNINVDDDAVLLKE